MGNEFQAKEGMWIGTKVGTFCTRPAITINDGGWSKSTGSESLRNKRMIFLSENVFPQGDTFFLLSKRTKSVSLQKLRYLKDEKKTDYIRFGRNLKNTIADLAQSTNYALKEAGFPTHPVDEYKFMVGNASTNSLNEHCRKEKTEITYN